MFGRTALRRQPSPYATSEDFDHTFERDISGLYCLSFLLAGNEALAEQCFIDALRIAQEATSVFKEWAEAWARRTIILNAIRVIYPRWTTGNEESLGEINGDYATDHSEIAEVVKLPVFERFAFVISVLEGYSDHECALHLGCTRTVLKAARSRALERIARAAEIRRQEDFHSRTYIQSGVKSLSRNETVEAPL